MNRPDESPKNSIIIYTTEDGLTKIDATFDGDTVSLSIDQMAELFQRDRSVIGKHVRNIFKEGELQKESVWAKFAYTAADGKVYDVDYYNLDVIISVGYRVKSKRGTQFRIWATGILKEYMRKGFALDDERLKNLGGGGYFKELLERIRDIRASEKVFYRQVLEIYATSIDYDPKAEISIQFFKKVQNKIHYAIHGQTAAEVIYTRADAEKEFMGLTTFAGSQPTLKEAVVAKNYLNEKELRAMGQLVSGYLDFAERQAEREQAMTMQDWSEHLDRILTMSGEQLLVGNGSVSHKQAIDKATGEVKVSAASKLAEVAVETAKTAKLFGIDPKVAVLSFSTKGSGKGGTVALSHDAVIKAQEMDPELAVDGELQFDAAVAPEVAQVKCKGSKVAGQANTFIFPCIEAGNIGYKIAQRLGGYAAYGPILQGLNAPINDLSRGCNADEVYKMSLITACQS